jgi:hypothetical protein
MPSSRARPSSKANVTASATPPLRSSCRAAVHESLGARVVLVHDVDRVLCGRFSDPHLAAVRKQRSWLRSKKQKAGWIAISPASVCAIGKKRRCFSRIHTVSLNRGNWRWLLVLTLPCFRNSWSGSLPSLSVDLRSSQLAIRSSGLAAYALNDMENTLNTRYFCVL